MNLSWRKLFRKDPPTYDGLPSRYRCLADRLLRFADENGNVATLGDHTPEQVVNAKLGCAAPGADRKADVRFHNAATKALLKSGHLYIEDDTLKITIQVWDKSKRRVVALGRGDTHGTVTGQSRDTHGTVTGHSRAPNSTETLDPPSQEKTRQEKTRPPAPADAGWVVEAFERRWKERYPSEDWKPGRPWRAALQELRREVEKLDDASDALSYALRRYFDEPSDHQHSPVAFVRRLEEFVSEFREQRATYQRRAYKGFLLLRDDLLREGQTPPECAERLPPAQLARFTDDFPDIDPASVRVVPRQPMKAEPSEEPRSKELEPIGDALQHLLN